jgi:probable F420-dependent oxidoreductase
VVKVRIGYTVTPGPGLSLTDLGPLAGELEALGFDSLWLPESMLTGAFDPVVGLTHVAACTSQLKVGTHLVVPGRTPVRMARELASLDRLSGGRLLLIGVIGLPDPDERLAQGAPDVDRGELLEETLEVARALWSGASVSYEGAHIRTSNARIDPLPAQQPLEVWLGGMQPAALRRCGRIGDGWIPGLTTPADAAARCRVIEEAALSAGRRIDPEHFGANITYRRAELTGPASERLRRRRVPEGTSVEDLVPLAGSALRDTIAAWVDAGFSKFLLRPADPGPDWSEELRRLADDVLDLQT